MEKTISDASKALLPASGRNFMDRRKDGMNRSLIVKELASELMLYNQEHDEVHILNTTARCIYQLLKEGRTVPEIEAAMKEAVQLDEHHDLIGDIHTCLEELKGKGLL